MSDINVTIEEKDPINVDIDAAVLRKHSNRHEAGGSDELDLGGLSTTGDILLDTGEVLIDYSAKEVPQARLGGPAASLSSFPLPNNDLVNSSVTVTAGDSLTGGGSVALGESVTLDLGTIEATHLAESYYTEAEADANFVDASGDTITGDLTFDTATLNTDGSGTGSVTIRDSANAQDLAVFNEGGDVSLPNVSNLSMSSHTLSFSDSTLTIDNGNFKTWTFENGGNLSIDDGSLITNQIHPSNSLDVRISSSGNFRVWDEGSFSNVFKVKAGGPVEVLQGNISFGPDRGAITGIDIGVTSSPTAGTEQSYSFDIGGTEIAKVYAEADGAGGIQNDKFVVESDVLSVQSDLEIRHDGVNGAFDSLTGEHYFKRSGTTLFHTQGRHLRFKTPNGTDSIWFSGGDGYIRTGNTGASSLTIYDEANAQDLAVFNEGGPVEIPSGDLFVNQPSTSQPKVVIKGESASVETLGLEAGADGAGKATGLQFYSAIGNKLGGLKNYSGTANDSMWLNLATTSGAEFRVQDTLNNQSVLEAKTGGNVEIPNGKFTVEPNDALLRIEEASADITISGRGVGGTDGRFFLRTDDNSTYFGDVDSTNGDAYIRSDGTDALIADTSQNIQIPNGNLILSGLQNRLQFKVNSAGTIGEKIHGVSIDDESAGDSIAWLRDIGRPASLLVKNTTTNTDLLQVNDDGTVKIPSGDLLFPNNNNIDLGWGEYRGARRLLASSNSDLTLKTGASGSNQVNIYDQANTQDVFIANEGGDVEIPNGKLLVRASGIKTETAKFQWGYNPSSSSFTYDGDALGHYVFGAFNDSGYNGLGTYISGYNFVHVFSSGTRSITADNGTVEIPNGDLKLTHGGQRLQVGDSSQNVIYQDGVGSTVLKIQGQNAVKFGRLSGTFTNSIHIGAGLVELNTEGRGSDVIRMHDTANAQDITRFKEGGNVEIPNGTLKLSEAADLEPTTEPTSPSSGWRLFTDSADGALKAKKSDGTVTTLAS